MRRYRKDDDGKRRLVRVFRGIEGFEVSWTTHCTGCCELGEYGGMAGNYGYDAKADCRVGSGCSECGYTGKRREAHWVPFDHDEAMGLMVDGPEAA